MLTDYTTALDALKARGLPAVLDSDRAGDHIVITLGGASKVTIGDLEKDLPHPQHLQGWSAHYTNLAGDPQLDPFFHTTETDDVEKLADVVADYVRQRNRKRLADEMVELVTRRLRSDVLTGRAEVYTERAGTWTRVNAYSDEDPARHLMISSHPQTHHGIHTTGVPVTGWTITEQRPGADPVTIYDAPADPDAERVADQVSTWIRRQTGRPQPTGPQQPGC